MKLNHYYLHFALTSVVCLSSCNKSLYINSNVENEQIALHKLKDLVGEKGQLFTFNLKDSNSLDKVKSNNISDSTKILTFEEFKKYFLKL